jgi:hypothetical protein
MHLSNSLARADSYSLADVASIVAYARERGIAVLPELDMPGARRPMQFCLLSTHSAAWWESGLSNWACA